jgi:Rrf2 family protein
LHASQTFLKKTADGSGTASNMLVTQKKQYALRAIFELAKQQGEEPLKTSLIAEAQAIPPRFLEVIMGQLKRAGLVDSKRGVSGGYTLIQPPDQIRVGEIFRVLDIEDNTQACMACTSKGNCPFLGDCVFMKLWNQAQRAMDAVYDQTTIQDLVDRAKKRPARTLDRVRETDGNLPSGSPTATRAGD